MACYSFYSAKKPGIRKARLYHVNGKPMLSTSTVNDQRMRELGSITFLSSAAFCFPFIQDDLVVVVCCAVEAVLEHQLLLWNGSDTCQPND